MKDKNPVSLYYISHPIRPAPFDEDATFPPMCSVGLCKTKQKTNKQVAMGIWYNL